MQRITTLDTNKKNKEKKIFTKYTTANPSSTLLLQESLKAEKKDSEQKLTDTSLQTLLGTLNDEFLLQHKKSAAKSALKLIDSVIVYKAGTLSLWIKEYGSFAQITSSALINSQYDTNKQIAHIPIHIQTILQDQTLSTNEKEAKLTKLKHAIAEVLLRAAELTGTPESIEAAKEILTQSLDFLNGLKPEVLESASRREMIISAFMSNLKPALNRNIHEAAKIQLSDTLDRIVSQWITTYGLNMENARVLIVGTHGPRKNLIEMQYFLKLYQEKYGIEDATDNKVYYVESIPKFIDKIDILADLIEDFLGSSELNKSYGRSLRNDPKFMFKDVLGEQAPAVLKDLFGKNVGNPSATDISHTEQLMGNKLR